MRVSQKSVNLLTKQRFICSLGSCLIRPTFPKLKGRFQITRRGPCLSAGLIVRTKSLSAMQSFSLQVVIKLVAGCILNHYRHNFVTDKPTLAFICVIHSEKSTVLIDALFPVFCTETIFQTWCGTTS